MSQSILNTLEVKTFQSDVHHEFISMGGKLRPTVRFVKIEGNSHQFPVYQAVEATTRIIGTDLILQNPGASAVTVTVVEYSAAINTDIFLASEVNYDAVQETVKILAGAGGRKEDQIIIDAIDAVSITKTVATNISGAADDLTVAAIADASRQLDSDDVPTEGRYFLANTTSKHHLTQESDVKTVDSNSVKTLVDGTVASFYGFEFNWIGTNGGQDGMPGIDTATAESWAYHKHSIGLALNMDKKVRVDYDPRSGGHIAALFFSAGAGLIDQTGIVEVMNDQS